MYLDHSSNIVRKVEIYLYKDGVTSGKNGILVQHKTQSKAIILLESPMNLSDFCRRESVIKDSKTKETLTFENLTMFSSNLAYCLSMMDFEDRGRDFRYQWMYAAGQVQWY